MQNNNIISSNKGVSHSKRIHVYGIVLFIGSFVIALGEGMMKTICIKQIANGNYKRHTCPQLTKPSDYFNHLINGFPRDSIAIEL